MLFLFVDICDAAEKEIGPFDEWLELHVPGTGAIWLSLKAGAAATPGQAPEFFDLDDLDA